MGKRQREHVAKSFDGGADAVSAGGISLKRGSLARLDHPAAQFLSDPTDGNRSCVCFNLERQRWEPISEIGKLKILEDCVGNAAMCRRHSDAFD
jgi:hypothetical protein